MGRKVALKNQQVKHNKTKEPGPYLTKGMVPMQQKNLKQILMLKLHWSAITNQLITKNKKIITRKIITHQITQQITKRQIITQQITKIQITLITTMQILRDLPIKVIKTAIDSWYFKDLNCPILIHCVIRVICLF